MKAVGDGRFSNRSSSFGKESLVAAGRPFVESDSVPVDSQSMSRLLLAAKNALKHTHVKKKRIRLNA